MEAYKIRKAERTARLNTLFYLYIYNLFNNFIIMKKIIYEIKEGEKYNYYASREEAYRSINYTSINHNNQLEINRILLLDNWDIEVIELYSLSDSIFNYDWIFRNLASFTEAYDNIDKNIIKEIEDKIWTDSPFFYFDWVVQTIADFMIDWDDWESSHIIEKFDEEYDEDEYEADYNENKRYFHLLSELTA